MSAFSRTPSAADEEISFQDGSQQHDHSADKTLEEGAGGGGDQSDLPPRG